MDVEDISRAAVLGAGNMGHGITEVIAVAGYEVTMRDIETDLVEDGYEDIEWSLEKLAEKGTLDDDPEDVLDRIQTTTDLEVAVDDADIVIEAAPERLDIKHDIFADLDEYTRDEAILATNTSSLPITDIAAVTDRPEEVVGTHFFNPPVKMDLVEVIYGDETADETAETTYAFMEAIDKRPIYVRKDVRGFVVNNVLLPFMNESAWAVSEADGEIRGIDAAMVYRRGYPMGPFELSDMTGLDIGVDVAEEAGDPVPPVLEERVDDGRVGRKAGKGYYDYEDGPGADYEPEDDDGSFDTLRVEARMVNEAAKLVGNDVATPEEIDIGMRLGTGFPTGTCRTGDKIGLDTVLEKLRDRYEATGADRYEPSDYLAELVEAGHSGEDAGRGFHEYGSAEREYQFLESSRDDDGVVSVVLDRPERMNALSEDVLSELDQFFTSLDPEDVRCVTVEGTGEAFSAGADIGGLATMSPTEAMDVTAGIEAVNDFPRPVLAKIDGVCLGGGFELALACDLRIATTDAVFGSPEISLGLIPGGGGTQRLQQLAGEARAKELVFRGNHIPAERAADWGIINRAVPPEEFQDTVDAFIDDLVSGPPIGLEVAKKVMNNGKDASMAAALTMESQGFGLLMSTEDVVEGTDAFLDDREPEFTGE